jgi:ankyrin repeat protein
MNAASVPMDAWHASGGIDEAERILAENPALAGQNVYAAATFGNAPAVQRFVNEDPENATRKGGPRNWDPLTYLCFSRYLKLDRSKSDGFIRCAKILLESGASPNTGWFEQNHAPQPEFESALYGAAGIAHHPEVTQLLLDHGADPNDGETCYHTPETYDNRALKVLVNSGKLRPESLALLLSRKADWHDYEGAKWLVENGADSNFVWRSGSSPLLHAIQRDCSLQIIEALVDHGGNPTVVVKGFSAISMAARRGRGDLLDLFERKGFLTELEPFEGIVAACARNDEPSVRSLGLNYPNVIEGLRENGGSLLCNFAGNGNTMGVRLLLEHGAPVWSVFAEGDGYYGVAENSTALHVAAWRIRPDTVKLLIDRGADVNAEDGRSRTPLMLAIQACISSYWMERRTPDCVDHLLKAGASLKGVTRLSGYEDIDLLLMEAGLKG